MGSPGIDPFGSMPGVNAYPDFFFVPVLPDDGLSFTSDTLQHLYLSCLASASVMIILQLGHWYRTVAEFVAPFFAVCFAVAVWAVAQMPNERRPIAKRPSVRIVVAKPSCIDFN